MPKGTYKINIISLNDHIEKNFTRSIRNKQYSLTPKNLKELRDKYFFLQSPEEMFKHFLPNEKYSKIERRIKTISNYYL